MLTDGLCGKEAALLMQRGVASLPWGHPHAQTGVLHGVGPAVL
jgi:hypothetical protein